MSHNSHTTMSVPTTEISNLTPNEQKGQEVMSGLAPEKLGQLQAVLLTTLAQRNLEPPDHVSQRLFACNEEDSHVCTLLSNEPWTYSHRQYDDAIAHQADVSQVAATCVAQPPANNSLARLAKLAKIRRPGCSQ